ncbi:MAG: glucose-6-phosphate isomerase [Prevotellaceae bacterium]|jgi:glucose-6-phosphate isomerase|nr:glucose-6-phosphate isomerase [Prevotellaceae bacterium]
MNIRLNIAGTQSFVDRAMLNELSEKAVIANRALCEGTGKGSDFLGWLTLPSTLDKTELLKLNEVGQRLRANSDVVVAIGIGGSYLGARAVKEALSPFFKRSYNADAPCPELIFAGHHLDGDYLCEMLEHFDGKRVSCIVVSKSGTTTEPAVAFRIVKRYIESHSGDDAKHRIVAVTDAERGALRSMAAREGFDTFAIPDNVGGRFSLFTPAGLLPLAVAGLNVEELLRGAADVEKLSTPDAAFEQNICAQYAAARNALYKSGKKIEILANYNPRLHFVAEWWKQLFGESEGKENKGIFPAGVDFTSDLHSLGQYIQEGERTLFETVLSVDKQRRTLEIPADDKDLDSLNYLAGKRIDEVNRQAAEGTLLAHIDGGVPNIRVEIPELNEYCIGQLVYFFEKSCGISGYLLDVNPFDQPGVEAYKRNMFALLGKPGFEAEGAKLKNRLAAL